MSCTRMRGEGACPAADLPRQVRILKPPTAAAVPPVRRGQRHHSSGVPGSEVPGSAAHAVLIHLCAAPPPSASAARTRRAPAGAGRKRPRRGADGTHASALAPFGAWNIANMLWAVLNTIACARDSRGRQGCAARDGRAGLYSESEGGREGEGEGERGRERERAGEREKTERDTQTGSPAGARHARHGPSAAYRHELVMSLRTQIGTPCSAAGHPANAWRTPP